MQAQVGAPPSALERAFVVLVLLLGTGAFMTLATTQGEISNQAGGSLGMETLWVLIYLIMLGLVYRHCPNFLRQFFTAWPLVVFCGLAMLSTIWSDDPSITFRRSVALLLTVIFGFYFVMRFSLREQLRLVAWVCAICIFFSIPFGLLGLGATVSTIPGAWHGVFVQKNDLGRVMALSVLVFLLLGKAERKYRWRTYLGILAAIVLLVLSKSATALVVTVLMFALFVLSGILRKSFRKALIGIIAVTICGTAALFWVFTHLSTFTDALGRNVTMSGRLQLWLLCIVMALQKPWLGYGYSAFWLGMNGPSFRIWRVLDFQMPHAHNGFIQVWLDLGLAGVALLIVTLGLYLVRAARMVRSSSQPEAAWPLMIMSFCFLYILTEVTIPGVNSIFMVLFSSCVFALSVTTLEGSRERIGQLLHSAGVAVPSDLGPAQGSAPSS